MHVCMYVNSNNKNEYILMLPPTILVDILMLEIQKKLQILSSVDGLAGK